MESFCPGFLPGSLDRNPKKKIETKKLTTVYTTIFNVSIRFVFKVERFYRLLLNFIIPYMRIYSSNIGLGR